MANPPKAKTGKKDNSRTNTGVRGAKGVQLTGIQKVLIGGGALRNINKPNGGKKRLKEDSSGRV